MFDPATLVFTFFTAQSAGTVALGAVWFINRQVPGIGFWVFGRISLGLGLLLLLLRFDIPLVVSAFISTTLILFGLVLAITGTRRFMDRAAITARWYAGFFLIFWSSLIYVTQTVPEASARHVTVSLALVVVSFVNSWSLWPNRTSVVQVSSRVMAMIFGFTGLFYMARTGWHIAMLAGYPMVEPVTDLVMVMLVGTATSVLIAATYTTMVTEHLQVDLRQQAETDPLTGLYNRRAFERVAQRDLQAAQRHRDPMFLLFLDLDHFKSINDRFGHPAGDRVIKALAETIMVSVRESDLSARFGGEEFAILLSRTDIDAAKAVAERIRSSIEVHRFDSDEGNFSATLSVGIAELDIDGEDTFENLIHRADKALYRAKRTGRNRIELNLNTAAQKQQVA